MNQKRTCFDLSKRKLEVLALAAQGLVNKEIANEMGLTLYTVRSHINQALTKTGCKNCVELVYRLSKDGKL